jgi:ankyrin repeat protein
MQGLENIADDHRNVARELKKIAQDEAKRQSSDRENECLQLFRLTGSDKDTTYESYKAQVEARVEGTCTWVLNQHKFSIWLAQDSGPLLISADPGCGKSVLAKYLIDDALCKDSTICYYFFRDQDQNTVRQLLCAVLHQLFCKSPALIKHAMGAFEKNGNKLINSTDSLWSILSNVLQEPETGKVILVMDALDECLNPELNKLLCGLGRQYRDFTESGTKVKYIFTTRPYEQILLGFKRNFNDASTIHIPGEEESDTISQEVNLVIQYRVERLAREMDLKDGLKERLTQELLEISHRTYLWVHLVFNFLQTERFKKTKDGITSAVRTLPKSVNAAYNQILSRSDDESMVRKALTIILAAERPLTLDEINAAMGIDPKTETFEGLDLECNEDFADSLRNCCGLFVSVYHGTVHFLHQTAREFLLAESGPDAAGRSNLKWEQFITLRQARHELAETSMRFFSLFKGRPIPIVDPALSQSWHKRRDSQERRMERGFRAGRILPEKLIDDHFYAVQALLVDDPLYAVRAKLIDDLPYAVRAFAIYAARFLRSQFLRPENCATQSPSPGLASKHFDPTSEPFQAWKCLLMDPEIDGFTSTLQMASRLGLNTVVAFLLQGNVNIELRDTIRRLTPLLWAVECGHFEAVKLLVKSGADVNAQTGHESVLDVAVRRIDKTIVKFLLGEGAEAKVEFSERLVEVASGKRKFDDMSEIVEMMLDAGADVNTQVDTLYSALGLAVSSGHNELAELLLNKGADVNKQGGKYGCALGSAAHAGHEESVELLLKRDAEIDAQAGDFGTALGAAAYKGHIGVVRLLSTWGADITKQGGKYGCALGSAVHSGHKNIVQLLLAKYSDANMPSWRYDCLLKVAATLGLDRADIAELLLDAGADADVLVGESFALEAAAYHGNPNVVDLLLARGADVNKQGGKYGCPLGAAVSCPSSKGEVIEVIERLVHYEVDIDAPCGNFGTVLGRAASIRGNEAVVELLIHLKADVHVRRGNFTNAVTAAAYGGDEETVRALLREGADIHAQGKFFPNALAAAVYAGRRHMVEILLDWGADIHQQGGLYFNAIGCAVRGNNWDMVHWLLEKGIEATLSKSGGWSPLLLASDQGSCSIVQRLLDHGVAQIPDDEGWTPLMRASYRGHAETIKLLLNRGADMTTVNKFGQTSLYIASSQGHIEVVRLLLDKRVNPNSSNRRGWTPLRAAIRNGHYEIATLLRQNNAEEVVASFF